MQHFFFQICIDEEVSIVLLPCGHLVSCVKCAPALRNCPICRKGIKGTVRTFMAWLGLFSLDLTKTYPFFISSIFHLYFFRFLLDATTLRGWVRLSIFFKPKTAGHTAPAITFCAQYFHFILSFIHFILLLKINNVSLIFLFFPQIHTTHNKLKSYYSTGTDNLNW